jgi:hypothetical protein
LKYLITFNNIKCSLIIYINKHINIYRYVTSSEAMWRIHEYSLHAKSHKIYRLAVHLPGFQKIIYNSSNLTQKCVKKPKNTTLTAWFKLNIKDPNAKKYLYCEIPYYYTFTTTGDWVQRKYKGKIISRLYTVSPKDTERFHLRVLLENIKGILIYYYIV